MAEPDRKLEAKAADSRPEDDGRAYYMVGPFGRVARVVLWSVLSVGLATGLGSLWALWSMAGSVEAAVECLKQIQLLLGR